MSKNSLLKVGVKSDSELNATGLEPQPTSSSTFTQPIRQTC